MKSFTWPVLGVILLFLLVCSAYNSKKCDDLPSQTGPCRAFFQKWRFIKDIRQCESFIYGGCQGTNNMFDDEEECKATCLS